MGVLVDIVEIFEECSVPCEISLHEHWSVYRLLSHIFILPSGITSSAQSGVVTSNSIFWTGGECSESCREKEQ